MTPVDATSDFAELVLAVLGVAAKLERRRIKERTAVDGALLKNRDVPNSPLLKVAA